MRSVGWPFLPNISIYRRCSRTQNTSVSSVKTLGNPRKSRGIPRGRGHDVTYIVTLGTEDTNSECIAHRNKKTAERRDPKDGPYFETGPSCLQYPYNRHHEGEVWGVCCDLKSVLYSVTVIVVTYVNSWKFGPCYNGTRLYLGCITVTGLCDDYLPPASMKQSWIISGDRSHESTRKDYKLQKQNKHIGRQNPLHS